MKKGAGDDPFVDDINDPGIEANADDDPEADPDPEPESESEFEPGGKTGQDAATSRQDVRWSNSEGGTEHEDTERSENAPVAATSSEVGSVSSADTELAIEPDVTAGPGTGTNATPDMNRSVASLPYLAKRQLRGLSVKDERNQIPFFLRNEVQRGEKALHRTVEDELGQDVNKTDLREAAYVFAQQHPEGVAETLRKWGIEYLE